MTFGWIKVLAAGLGAIVVVIAPPHVASAGPPYTITPTTGGTDTQFVVNVPICAGKPEGFPGSFYVVNPDDEGERFQVPLDGDGQATFTVSVAGDTEVSATEVALVDPQPYITGFDCVSAPGVRHAGGWPDSPGATLTFEAAAPVGPTSTSTSTSTSILPPPPTTPVDPSGTEAPHDRAAIASSVRPVDAPGVGPEELGLALLIATAAALLLVFPSALFNSTMEEHYDEVVGWLPWHRETATPEPKATNGPGMMGRFALLTATSALLYGLLDPQLGFDRASVAQVLGIGVSLVVLSLVGAGISGAYLRRRRIDAGARFEGYPWVLGVAVVCVLVSRLLDFQPGYLYGLIGGLAVSAELSKREDGRARAVAAVGLLVVSLAAWVVSSAVADSAEQLNPGFATIVLDGLLGAIVVAGIEGLVFGLIPLRSLPGESVVGWSRRGWLALFAAGLVLYAHVLVRPAAGDDTAAGPPIATTIGLFVVFGVASVTFWGYFRFRPERGEGLDPVG